MAKFVMKNLVKKIGLAAQLHVESVATSTKEIGSPLHPPARRKLTEHGIDYMDKTVRQLMNSNYNEYNLLIGMERANLRNMHRICCGDHAGKMCLLMDYTDHPGDTAEPQHTNDLKTSWHDVLLFYGRL